jgi:hypothetical protein
MNNYCEVCVKNFSCNRSYQTHISSNSHKIRYEKSIKLFKCLCGRTFNQLSGLSRHKKKCNQTHIKINATNKPEQIIQLLQCQLNKKDEEMRERLDKKDKEMDELRKQVEALLRKTAKTTTNNIQTQNNINQNVHIVVNSFGNENIDHLTDQIICKLIQTAPFTCVPELIQKIHFDPEHPENHNIKLTNKKMNYAEIVKDNKWVTANKKQVIDDVIQNSYNLLDEKFADNKESISERRQGRFENFQDKYEDNDEETMRNMKNDVDLILINGTNEVHKS